jgi:hypothetical protein
MQRSVKKLVVLVDHLEVLPLNTEESQTYLMVLGLCDLSFLWTYMCSKPSICRGPWTMERRLPNSDFLWTLE